MTRAIPEQIVAAVTTLAESLASWCEEGRDGRLEQHEEAVLERVRRVLPALLEAVVGAATSELAPRVRTSPSAWPGCGRKARPHQERSRRVLTRCGAIAIERPWCACGRCHHGWSVVETTLGVVSRQRASAGLLGWLARLGTTTNYLEAAGLLDELTGLAVGPETIRRECIRVGTAIRAAEAAAIERAQRTREAAEPLDPAPGLLVLEADGATIQSLDGRHEAKLGMVAGWDRDRLVAPSYVAARATSATPRSGCGAWRATRPRSRPAAAANPDLDPAELRSDQAIVADGLVKRFGDRTVLDDVSFVLGSRARVVIVGENGAGKSILLDLIAWRTRPDAGNVRLAGGVRLGYLDQDATALDRGRTLVESYLDGLDGPRDELVNGLSTTGCSGRTTSRRRSASSARGSAAGSSSRS